ncbi:MAG: hypothetical protein CMJ46_12645 [Planctomyces sp.]|nr:hypothetical protein [Planctomyces sp.]
MIFSHRMFRVAMTLSIVTTFGPALCGSLSASDDVEQIETDLLIVGGTESGCAAAVQAARMGVESITIVNDIEWLGGQFTAESLVAIDENRPPSGYGNGVPFPRAGLFKEVMDRIEAINEEKFGHPRPGNTQVITTALPSDAERAFRDLLAPGTESGQIQVLSNYEPVSVDIDTSGEHPRVTGVRFAQRGETRRSTLNVCAELVIDASDWGDVISLSGAGYEFGPDLKSKYDEPLAPATREGYPLTDMNPITYNMLIEETDTYEPIPKPAGYDIRNYTENNYPKDPAYIYRARRIIDHYGFSDINHPDVILLCFAPCDYPLDVLPRSVVERLEANEAGASQKNIAEMTPAQRRIVFEDAKQHSLGYLYYLQTAVHDQMADKTHSFRRFKLKNDFGTADSLPPKPYIRESLRLQALHMLKQQDTTGFNNNSLYFADCMFHDGIACFQFEYDFHPTKRVFLDENNPAGPWRNAFRKGRTWGPPYSGLSLFPARSVIPTEMRGLLGAQKNLGYTSIVSSAVRLHDQSMAIGQGIGALAAVAINTNTEPHAIPFQPAALEKIWSGLCANSPNSIPAMLWPWRDLEPDHPAFVAVNQLSIRQLLPIDPTEVEFQADSPAEKPWREAASALAKSRLAISDLTMPDEEMTRGEFAIALWSQVHSKPLELPNLKPDDRDADGIADEVDPLPYTTGTTSWTDWKPDPTEDGLPDERAAADTLVAQFYFGGPETDEVDSFVLDSGAVYSDSEGYGWRRSLRDNHRDRGASTFTLKETFLFTRTHDLWEYNLPPGKYRVTVCIGDSVHEQFGQHVAIEGEQVLKDKTTRAGHFMELSEVVTVDDGLLTLEIGTPGGTTNTCLNWLRIEQISSEK